MPRGSNRTKSRPIVMVALGLTVFTGAVAAEALTEPRGWVRVLAFVAWCVAAFGMGMSYRNFVQRARQRRGRR